MPGAANCLIIGGGVAGLSTAIALQRAGVQCDVIEIGEEPVGASMSLTGRSVDALVELGIYDECFETGAPFTPAMMSPVMNDAAGNPMGPPPPPRPLDPQARLPLGVFRPTFAAILEATAQGLGATQTKGMTVDAIAEGEDGVHATLSTGERRRYDFLIGADGINSRTRSLLFPDASQPEYAGQWSIRWMIPGPALPGEGWYVAGAMGRLGFFHMPKQKFIYAPIVLNMPERRMSQQESYEAVKLLLDQYSAPAVVALREHLRPDSILISRPFKWMWLPEPWHRGRCLLIGDAAHATTAHMGMGAGMALEDAVVLAQCIGAAGSLDEAFAAFMARRFDRVRTVVETSVALSRLEQQNAPPQESGKIAGPAFAKISQPY